MDEFVNMYVEEYIFFRSVRGAEAEKLCACACAAGAEVLCACAGGRARAHISWLLWRAFRFI